MTPEYVDASDLIQPDTRTEHEKRLDAMMEERGANEMGADAVRVLRGIALELMAQIGQGEPEEGDLLTIAYLHGFAKGKEAASAHPAPQANKTHVLVPLRMTRAMQDVVSEEDWSWADLLAAAEAATEDECAVAEQTEPIMPQAAVMQQKPLLFSEIWDNDAIMEVNADARLPFEMIERFVRAIEAAHNIGEKK